MVWCGKYTILLLLQEVVHRRNWQTFVQRWLAVIDSLFCNAKTMKKLGVSDGKYSNKQSSYR